jgi:hypothetical protein
MHLAHACSTYRVAGPLASEGNAESMMSEDEDTERELVEDHRRGTESGERIRRRYWEVSSPSPKRDAQGRWMKGSTGNPNGRPPKLPRLSQSDPFIFAQTLMPLKINGETVELTQREAVTKKLLESALKGSVQAQIFLAKEFKWLDELQAHARLRLEELEKKQLKEPPTSDVAVEIEAEIAGLRRGLGLDFSPPRRRRRRS